MSDKLDNIELRSEEVQDVLEKAPNWMLRWGMSLLFTIFFIILSISWFIRYPDVIKASALITTRVPPQKIYATVTGQMDSIYVKNGEKVRKGTVLGVIRNQARTRDVFYLKSILDTIDINKEDFSFPFEDIPILFLGGIEASYANFEESYTNYILHSTLNINENRLKTNRKVKKELEVRLLSLIAQKELGMEELELKQRNNERSKSLLKKGVISKLDFENNKLELLSTERSVRLQTERISELREAIANLDRDGRETQIENTQKNLIYKRNIAQTYVELVNSIMDWEEKYVFKSELDGTVNYIMVWTSNQKVNEGDFVFSIMPQGSNNYVGKLQTDAINLGKIREGQVVNISLDNFPNNEYGILKGHILNISPVQNGEGLFDIEVGLPNKLITTYGKELVFRQEIVGRGEIITEDLRLLERFFYQFKGAFQN